jgi:aspartate 1-decarboxylase
MLRTMLFAKIHGATVTQCDPSYVGSITIDTDLLDATGLRVNEKVLVCDVDTGSRFETYIFKGEAGSGIIGVNGAAARLTSVGNSLLIMSFCQLSTEDLDSHRPTVVILDANNRVDRTLEYPQR